MKENKDPKHHNRDDEPKGIKFEQLNPQDLHPDPLREDEDLTPAPTPEKPGDHHHNLQEHKPEDLNREIEKVEHPLR